MSAHDEECGCGEYSCRRCFTSPPRPVGNAWIDEAIIKRINDMMLRGAGPEEPEHP